MMEEKKRLLKVFSECAVVSVCVCTCVHARVHMHTHTENFKYENIVERLRNFVIGSLTTDSRSLSSFLLPNVLLLIFGTHAL